MRQIANRKELPTLLNELDLTGIGVEVGVLRGVFSEWILANSQILLVSVDSWAPRDWNYGDGHQQVTQESQDKNYIKTIERLKKYGGRSIIYRLESLEAAKIWSKSIIADPFHFIYLDADHTYEYVKKELEAWWPLLAHGGIFDGHDYLDEKQKEAVNRPYYGVKEAVDEFVLKHNLELFVTDEKYPTWYLRK